MDTNFDYEPFFRLLKEKKISEYKLIHDYKVDRWVLRRMKDGMNVNVLSLANVMTKLGVKNFDKVVRIV